MYRSLLALGLVLGACGPATVTTTDNSGSAAGLEAQLGDPSSSSSVLGWVKQEVVGFVGTFSATNGATFYPTESAAREEILSLLAAGGIADPDDAVFITSVGMTPLPEFDWDHSEYLIESAVSISDGHIVPLHLRTVGDPWGAGVFTGQFTEPFGPKLCVSWDSLQNAITVAYLPGVYAVDYVCHTDTLQVIEALGVAPEWYQPQIGGWKLARWAYGPLEDSGLSITPADWAPTQMCQRYNLAQ